MNIDEIKKELKDTKRQIGSLEDRARKLRNVLRKIESIEYIKANSITKDDVQLSSGDDVPYFDTAWTFAEWLKDNSTKRYCEWNNKIYFRHDLVNGRLTTESKGWVTELES